MSESAHAIAPPSQPFLQRHALVIGIALMFALTWPIDLANSGRVPWHPPFVVYLFLGWGFVVAALAMTALTGGRAAVVALLRRFLIWRVGAAWWCAALLLTPAIMAIAVCVDAALGGTPIDFTNVFAHKIFGPAASLPMFVVPFFLVDAISNGEEIGWRGYVLPRLQARHSALVASLIVGVVWAIWHVPKFLAPGNTSSFAVFFVKIVAESVLTAWLYNSTKGSLLLVTAFHAAGNTAGVFLPVANTVDGSHALTAQVQAGLDVVVAAVVVALAGAANLSRTLSKQVQT